MRTISGISLGSAILLSLLSAILPGPVLAGQGFYASDKNIRPGMLVSLTSNPGFVEPATNKNTDSLVGVVGQSETDFTVKPDQISVQTDGVVNVLVSTASGDILVGDKISPSAISGVGVKSSGGGWVVGVAQGSFDKQSKGAVKSTVRDSSGNSQEVYVGTIPVLVKITKQNESAKDAAVVQKNETTPNSLQKIADTLSGKHTSSRALILSFILFVIGVGAAALIINSAIRSGFLAVSRQPLSKVAIVREERRSFVLAFGILVFTLLASYMMLKIL